MSAELRLPSPSREDARHLPRREAPEEENERRMQQAQVLSASSRRLGEVACGA